MSATLPSNSGEERFVIEFGAHTEYSCETGFECSIHISGRHWDGDHTFPFSTSIEGLWLRLVDLKELEDHLAKWTTLPLDRLLAGNLDKEFELARLPSQQVRIRFGQRSETISGPNPVVSFSFSAGALRVEFYFVTDQSCLTLFARELSAELAKS